MSTLNELLDPTDVTKSGSSSTNSGKWFNGGDGYEYNITPGSMINGNRIVNQHYVISAAGQIVPYTSILPAPERRRVTHNNNYKHYQPDYVSTDGWKEGNNKWKSLDELQNGGDNYEEEEEEQVEDDSEYNDGSSESQQYYDRHPERRPIGPPEDDDSVVKLEWLIENDEYLKENDEDILGKKKKQDYFFAKNDTKPNFSRDAYNDKIADDVTRTEEVLFSVLSEDNKRKRNWDDPLDPELDDWIDVRVTGMAEMEGYDAPRPKRQEVIFALNLLFDDETSRNYLLEVKKMFFKCREDQDFITEDNPDKKLLVFNKDLEIFYEKKDTYRKVRGNLEATSMYGYRTNIKLVPSTIVVSDKAPLSADFEINNPPNDNERKQLYNEIQKKGAEQDTPWSQEEINDEFNKQREVLNQRKKIVSHEELAFDKDLNKWGVKIIDGRVNIANVIWKEKDSDRGKQFGGMSRPNPDYDRIADIMVVLMHEICGHYRAALAETTYTFMMSRIEMFMKSHENMPISESEVPDPDKRKELTEMIKSEIKRTKLAYGHSSKNREFPDYIVPAVKSANEAAY